LHLAVGEARSKINVVWTVSVAGVSLLSQYCSQLLERFSKGLIIMPLSCCEVNLHSYTVFKHDYAWFSHGSVIHCHVVL